MFSKGTMASVCDAHTVTAVYTSQASNEEKNAVNV